MFALALARVILGCQLDCGGHPDLHLYRPEGKIAMHSMETLRALTEQVMSYPRQAAKQVLIVHDADRMLPTSANALLKTFEEPAPQAVIILLSSNPQALLPTVRSRCRTLSFQPIAEETIAQWLVVRHGCDSARARWIASRAKGSVAKALRLLQGGDAAPQPLLDLLAMGKVNTYKALTEALQPLCETLEELKEQLQISANAQWKSAWAEMTATQKEAQQKEIDGAITLRFREEAQALLMDILGWYRDLQLLQAGGEPRYLTHRHEESRLRTAVARGRVKSLESVESAIQAVKVAIERSTPLKSCLEGLFLKLDFLCVHLPMADSTQASVAPTALGRPGL
jgi:DNA polymerase-3 subunit delta'